MSDRHTAACASHASSISLLAAAVSAALFLSSPPTFALPLSTTWTVESCADDGGPTTLRAIVAGTADGDTVDLSQLQCGTITLETGQIEVHADNLTLIGPGRDQLTIDANYTGRVFLHDGYGTLTLRGLTIAHGLADGEQAAPEILRGGYGGCILSVHSAGYNVPPAGGGSVTLIDSTVTSCTAVPHHSAQVSRGGGIFATHSVTLWNSTISDNVVDAVDSSHPGMSGSGGGFIAFYGAVEIHNSVISGNRVETLAGQASGGGFSSYWRPLDVIPPAIIENSSIVNNFAGCDPSTTPCEDTAVAFGGGMNVGLHVVTIASSVISQNELGIQAGGSGAGVFEYGGDLQITDSIISDNHINAPPSAFTVGGGVVAGGCDNYLSSTRSVRIERSTLAGNDANQGGGIWSGADCLLSVSNSTLSGNTAHLGGGAIYNLGGPYTAGPMSIFNSTITENASEGSQGAGGILDLHTSDEPSVIGSTILSGNIATDASASYDDDLGVLASSSSLGHIDGSNNLIGEADNVELPPDTIGGDPLLGPLQDNGGATPTHALSSDSPAINAGNNEANLEWDQRGAGYARVVDGMPDIGAYEFGAVYVDTIFSDDFEVDNVP